ncbi:RDD family protein [Aciduricibacillus chroicocephali]|uniref:RDD family protein n=1 Tax=Aciduricibacillus chroicocephali TaxID=3054939 RepID=A0ABY9KV71_9BACI|nr:RDD family protein [Bacillaceae bacterium 44XB]
MVTYKPAGFWIRLLAAFLDGIFSNVLAAIVTAIIGEKQMLIGELVDPTGEPIGLPLTSFSVSLLYAIIFIIIFTATHFRGSPGKLICRIQVLNKDMTQIGIGKSIGRYFAQILSAIPLMIGYMIAGWNREKKALHDMICGTRVVYRDEKKEEEPVLYE